MNLDDQRAAESVVHALQPLVWDSWGPNDRQFATDDAAAGEFGMVIERILDTASEVDVDLPSAEREAIVRLLDVDLMFPPGTDRASLRRIASGSNAA